MSVVFPSITIKDELRGSEYNYRTRCVVASNPDANWTTTATATFASPTLTISSLTSSGSTIGTIDGYTSLAVGNRILLKDMGLISGGGASNDSFNGIWDITGGSATSLTAVRSYDLQEGDETHTICLWARYGTVNSLTAWICVDDTTVANDGSNPFTFIQFDARDTLSVERGGTGSIAFTSGNVLIGNGTSAITSTKPAPTGDFIGTNDVQTLTNKTLTSPRIGTAILDTSGNELLLLTATASAINEITLANSAIGTNPTISASGEDTNIGLNFQSKGTGVYRFLGTATSHAEIQLYEDSDNGTNYTSWASPASVATTTTLRMPDGVGSTGQFLTTDGNNPATLTWGSPSNVFSQSAPTSLADSDQTLTIVQLLGDIMTITPTTTRNLTLPTAVDAVAGVSNVAVGSAFDFRIINLGTGASDPEIILLAGAGGSIVGNEEVFPHVNNAGTYNYSGTGVFRMRITNITASSEAYVVYRIA